MADRHPHRRIGLVASAAFLVTAAAFAASGLDDITNYREYSPLLSSSGQPKRKQFSLIRDAGFERVIFLAPYDSHGSFEEEADIVPELGMEYVHVPIVWDAPRDSDFETVARAMLADPDKKTLIHCQVNFRASSISFLYRVIHGRVPIAEAKEDLDSVWVPNDTWREYIFATLAAHGISPDCDTCIWETD